MKMINNYQGYIADFGHEVSYPSLTTPSVLLDLDKLEANITRMQKAANEAGVRLKPHTKIHLCVEIAKMQIQAGASGIEVGSIEQVEVMTDGGIYDIVVAHPFFGDHKFEALRKLLKKPKLKLTLVVDMVEQVERVSAVAQAAHREVPIFIKIDTGVDRYGVLPGEPTLDFANKIKGLPNTRIVGIYAHESGLNIAKGLEQGAFEVATATAHTAQLLTKHGFILETVAVGASPTYWAMCSLLKTGRFPEITEIHPGALAIGDVSLIKEHCFTLESCALTVLTTVMSTSHPNHIVTDAGFKTFGFDSIIGKRDTPGFFWKGRPSFGVVQGRPDLWFGRPTAERGVLYYMENAKKDVRLGDRLEIIPNNATLVINIHDILYGVRNGRVEKIITVSGRGKGS